MFCRHSIYLTLALLVSIGAGTRGSAEEPPKSQPQEQEAKQAELSREHRNANRPSQDAILAEGCTLKADQAYGTDPLQRLDVYSPAGADSGAGGDFCPRG